jgi:hypothetical protein
MCPAGKMRNFYIYCSALNGYLVAHLSRIWDLFEPMSTKARLSAFSQFLQELDLEFVLQS